MYVTHYLQEPESMNALSCVAFSGDTSRLTAMAKNVFSMHAVCVAVFVAITYTSNIHAHIHE